MADNARLTPLEMIAREMEQHSELSREQIEEAIALALEHLMKRAARRTRSDEMDLSRSIQYQAVSEALLFLGTQLIAFEDIETQEDPDDIDSLKN